MNRLAPADLVITQGTAAFGAFEAHLEATAHAGCRGVSIWVREYHEAIKAGATAAGLGRLLAERDLICNDVDAHIVWAGVGEPPPGPIEPQPIGRTIEAGQALSATHANVLIAGDDGYDQGRAIDRFGRAAEDLLAAGLVPTLEFVPQPISPVDDVLKAWDIIDAVGLKQVGVMLDTWHFMRGPSTFAMLDVVPIDRIGGVQISDAPLAAMPDLLHETMHERLLPGEGAVPLVDLLRRVEEGASPAPYTLEIFSDAHNAHGPEQAVARAVASLERVCEAVSNRGGG